MDDNEARFYFTGCVNNIRQQEPGRYSYINYQLEVETLKSPHVATASYCSF